MNKNISTSPHVQPPAANKAQQAIQIKLAELNREIANPLSSTERDMLVDILRKTPIDSLWGVAIRRVLDNPDHTQAEVDQLVEQLGSQTLDDPFTMNCVVGHKGMLLLLRSTL